jgi:mono/diheme cytochrome c family protein
MTKKPTDFRLVGTALLALVFLVLFLAACSGTASTPADPTALPYSDTVDAVLQARVEEVQKEGNPESGKEVFSRHCQSCHSLDEAVVLVGPSLSAAGDRMQYAYIITSIENPHDETAAGGYELVMPEDLVTRLSAQEINDVIAYVASLQD